MYDGVGCGRFGAMEAPLERGAVSPGTYCTRTYEECHRKPCRLQSPNYPGMYPRCVRCACVHCVSFSCPR